jgi:hypothetical protein
MLAEIFREHRNAPYKLMCGDRDAQSYNISQLIPPEVSKRMRRHPL